MLNTHPLRVGMKNNNLYEPWKNFISRPTTQDIFYYCAPMQGFYNGKKTHTFYIHANKEIDEIVAYTHPMVAILCRAVFDTWQDDDMVWMVQGKPEDSCCSVEGRVGLKKCTVIKRTTFKLWMVDAFKIAGGAIMKVHEDKTFTEWFLDSIGDRVNQNTSSLELSRFSRNIAVRYEDTEIDKSYEYLAVANLAEYKESKEPEWSRRRKLGQSFLYAIHAAVKRGKDINLSEICEKTLTLIRTEEKIGLPVKVEKKFKDDDDDGSGWSPHSMHA